MPRFFGRRKQYRRKRSGHHLVCINRHSGRRVAKWHCHLGHRKRGGRMRNALGQFVRHAHRRMRRSRRY